MYMNPILVGVLGTIFFEMLASFVVSFVVRMRKGDK